MEKMDPTQNIQSEEPAFNTKYKTVVACPYEKVDINMLDWLNDSSENRGVAIIAGNLNYFIGFENSDDALIFKIKYL